jgi:O-antigen biosynthesis protein WbqP
MINYLTKRILDFCLLIPIFCLSFLPIIFISIFIAISSSGPIIHWSKRIGRNNKVFLMPKFRTMSINTPDVATHLLEDKNYITSVGKILRRMSLDELPQLYSILKGDMTFVGPRPALHNQIDLINQRTKLNVHLLIPGLTGLAQINGRDEIEINEKVMLDYQYAKNNSVFIDIKIILLTLKKVFKMKDISH